MWVKGADSVKNTWVRSHLGLKWNAKIITLLYFGHLMIYWSSSIALAQNTILPALNPQEA